MTSIAASTKHTQIPFVRMEEQHRCGAGRAAGKQLDKLRSPVAAPAISLSTTAELITSVSQSTSPENNNQIARGTATDCQVQRPIDCPDRLDKADRTNSGGVTVTSRAASDQGVSNRTTAINQANPSRDRGNIGSITGELQWVPVQRTEEIGGESDRGVSENVPRRDDREAKRRSCERRAAEGERAHRGPVGGDRRFIKVQAPQLKVIVVDDPGPGGLSKWWHVSGSWWCSREK